jgi:hypothetical protein
MNCPALNLFTKCFCRGLVICPFCIQLTIAVVAVLFGTLLTWKPKKVIEIQIALYRPFNWRLEPISMEKEIRSTRIMGFTLIVIAILSLGYVLFF